MQVRLRRCTLVLPGLLVASAACDGEHASTDTWLGSSTWPVVYGDDDRVEAFAVDDAAFRELAETRAVAIMFEDPLQPLQGVSLGERAGLCEGEAFADQPSLASCSALLVEADLVLTAGHCAVQIPCDQMRLVLGFYYEQEGALAALDPQRIFACSEVLSYRHSEPTEGERLDYAWIRLDRSVPGYDGQAIRFRDLERELEPGEPVWMFGFPNGIPLKVDRGAQVTDPRDNVLDYFVATTDSFFGNSGSPLFDADAQLVGIQNRGAADLVTTDAGCSVVSRQPDDASVAAEEATYASRALDGLCDDAPGLSICAVDEGGDKGCSVGSYAAGNQHAPLGLLSLFALLGFSLKRGAKRRTLF